MKNSGLKVVLNEPEIPQNTGNIARLCACTGSELFLVGKLGFSLSEKHIKRAGLDYWDSVKIRSFFLQQKQKNHIFRLILRQVHF